MNLKYFPRFLSALKARLGLLVPCMFCCVVLLPPGSALAQSPLGDVVITSSTAWPSGTYSATGLTVKNGATLTIGGGSTVSVSGAILVTANSNVVLQSINTAAQVNGVWAGAGVSINAASVEVDKGSTINADGQGYVSGISAAGVGPGGGSDSNHGGSYGGVGSNQAASTIYGSSIAPSDLGSGGFQYSGDGGNGGGAIKLQVTGPLTNNGIIAANAGPVTGYTSGGAGGSVYVITQALTGSGSFTANGASNTSFQTKDGGGGRIAIDYADSTGFTSFTASKANGGAYASVGTAVFVDTSVANGNLSIYQNFTIPANSTVAYNQITVANGGLLTIGGGSTITVTGGMLVTGNSKIVLQSLNNTSQVSGAWVGKGVVINAGSMQVDTGSTVNADGQGYTGAASGVGAGPAGGQDSNHGGSYGGAGVNEPASSVYGSAIAPVDLGSGGSQYAGGGGNGGGALRLQVSGTLTNNGVISANAGPVTGFSSGGAGGSVFVTAQTLTGSGIFTANGGLNTDQNQKDGGGGRIAINYGNGTGFTGFAASTVRGGASASTGTAVFVDTSVPNGNVSVYQNFTLAPSTTTQFNSLTLASGATMAVGGGAQVFVTQALHVTGTLLAQSINTAVQGNGAVKGKGVRILAGSIQVDAAGTISADGQGYLPTYGPSPAPSSTYGASYGGAGGNQSSASTYGSATAPVDLGSGGFQYAGDGGNGGGAIALFVTGALTNNGVISANAGPVTGFTGAGAGGSVYVAAHTITGTGTYSANGGVNTGFSDRNGGGGRIAIDYVANQGVAQSQISATASPAASAGTISLVSGPTSLWVTPTSSVVHGVTTLQWFTDAGVSTSVTASGPETFTVATGAGDFTTTTWDTTQVPDGTYQLVLKVMDAGGNVIQELPKSVVINNSVLWYSGTLSANTHWTASNVYALDGNLVVPSGVTLSIDPGTVVKALPGSEIIVQSGGTLNAAGTVGATVIFTTFDDSTAGGNTDFNQGISVPSPGEWGGIQVLGGGTYTSNSNTVLRYAQTLLSGTISSNRTLMSTQNYEISGNLIVAGGVTLTVQPGTVVKLDAGAGIDVQPGATLLANGTLAQPIYFTSINDSSIGGTAGSTGAPAAPGDWSSILIDAATASFQHVQMQYGGGPVGSPNQSGMIETDGAANVTISSSTLAFSYAIGIQTGYPNGGGDTITVTDSTFYGNEDRTINAFPGSTVHVVNDTFDGNAGGVASHGGTVDVENSVVSNSIGAQFGGISLCCGGTFSNLANNNVYTTISGVPNYSGITDPTGTRGNISKNPVYMNGPQHDYRPNYGSPLIDAADGTVANYPAKDAFGMVRYSAPLVPTKTGTPDTTGAYPEIGAFEFVQSASSNLDLTVSNVSGPSSGIVGTQATVTWTVTNVGSGTVYGPWHDAVYLATDTGTNAAEVLAGQVLEGAGFVLGPGASYSATATVTVPGVVTGSHRWEIKTNVLGEVFEGVNTANNTAVAVAPVEADVTALTPGAAPLTGAFAGTGQSSFYKIALSSSQTVSVQLALSGAVTGSVQIFVGAGYVPSPQHYDYQQVSFGGATASVTVPSGAAQTYYVTAYAQSLPLGSASFTIEATSVQFSLTAVTPGTAVTQGSSTLKFTGGGFTSSTVFQLVSANGTVYAPTSTFLSDSTEADVTFALANAPAGTYSAQAINGTTLTLANAITLTSGTSSTSTIASNVQVTVEIPEAFRAGFPSLITVNYTNIAAFDIPAPLIYISATNATVAEIAPQCDGCDVNFALKYGARFSSGLVLGINQQGPAGILPAGGSGSLQFMATPGASGTASFYASASGPSPVGNVLVATPNCASSAGCIPEPSVTGAYDTGLAFCSSLAPVGTNPIGLERSCMALLNSAGFTYIPFSVTVGQTGAVGSDTLGKLTFAQFNSLLAADATTLSAGGTYQYDVPTLLAFELRKDGLSVFNTRYHQGAFGFGVSEPFDVTLTGGAGTLLERFPDGSSRGFPVLSPTQPNTYLGSVGDYGTATLQDDGSWLITEADGTLYHFVSKGGGYALDFIQDRNSNKSSVSYTNNFVTGVADAFGGKLNFQYDPLGHITQITDGNGRTATYGYTTLSDSQHSTFLASITDPRGTTNITWNQGGSSGVGYYDDSCVATYCQPAIGISSISYPDGTHIYFTYDAVGRVAGQSRDGGAQSFTYTYNNSGSVTVTDAFGKSTIVEPNELGQPLSIVDPLGGVARIQYDAEGKPINSIGALGDSSFVTYDHAGNFASATSPSGNTTNFAFLGDQTPASLTDPLGNTLSFGYDATFNLLSKANASGDEVKYTYDSNGRPLTRTNRRGNMTTFAYGTNGLLSSKTYSNSTQVQYGYDGDNNLQTVTAPNGVTTYQYDSADRMTSVNYPDGTSIHYTYNANGQCTSMTDSTGFVTNYQYDQVGRLSGLTNSNGAVIASYTYNANGRLLTKTLGNGNSTSLTYDEAGDLLSVINYSATKSILSEYDYTYDAEGHPITQTSPTGNFTYTYDLDGQLTGATAPSKTIQYTYDASGNRTSVTTGGSTATYLPNNLNEYQSANGVPYQYDADGNVISGNGWTYTYNEENKVLTMVNKTDSWSFNYDGLGNRVASVHNGKTTHYLIDPYGYGNIAAEFDGNGTPLAHYTYGAGLASTVTPAGTASYYLFDGVGNTTQLTSSSGSVVNSYSYLPFGEQTVLSASVANPFTFAGQSGVVDEGNGLYFMRNRWYNPTLGRFQQLDPIYLAGGENLYRYVNNSPLFSLDPLGLNPFREVDYATVSASAILSVGGQVNLHNGEATVSIGVTNGGGFNASLGHLNGLAPGVDRGAATSNFNGGASANFSSYAGAGGGITISSDGSTSTEFGVGAGGHGGGFSFAVSNINDELQDHLIPLLTDQTQQNVLANQPSMQRVYPDPPPDPCATCITIPGLPFYGPIKMANDPNGKITSGFGDQGYIPAGVPITYTIFFENQQTATLPAQKVTVTDTLSSSLDWSTVQLNQITFNNVVLNVPDRAQTYTEQASVSTDANPVKVAASLNPLTGQLTWTMQSIDAITSSSPANPLAGFLPPNNSSNAGTGSVTFTVMPKAALANAAAVTNQASITFDANAAILTNVVTNTLDKSTPTSAISSLPATSNASSFTVGWTGSDPSGSGIASYNIYVSIDGGVYSLWLSSTTLTSATFSGVAGHSYSFVSLATNSVGIQQVTPAAAQTIAVIGSLALPTVTVTPGSSSITTAQAPSVGIAISGSTTAPTGSVVLSSGSYTSTTTPLNAGKATIVVPAGALAIGMDNLSVVYTPDNASAGIYTSAVGSASIIVTAAAVLTASVTPSSVTFTSVANVASSPQTVQLQNTSASTLTITSVALNGTNASAFSQTNTCGATLAANASCTISITFTPTVAGTFTGALTITDNAATSPQTVALTGTGTSTPTFTLSAAPSTLTIPAGNTATFTISAASQGGIYAAPIGLAVTGLPAGATATFQPASITPGSTGATSTLTVKTSAQKATSQSTGAPIAAFGMFGALLLIGKRRRWGLAGCVLTLLLLVIASALSGCGSNPPSTTYTLTVTGTGGSIVQTTTATLIVH
jgi:RHS repeat-associated protein